MMFMLIQRTTKRLCSDIGNPIDTRPGIRNIFSYDKEGRVTKVVNGEGEKPNRCIVKLLHEKGSEKVNELYLMPIDYSGSVELTKRKRKQKRYLNGKNVVVSSIL